MSPLHENSAPQNTNWVQQGTSTKTLRYRGVCVFALYLIVFGSLDVQLGALHPAQALVCPLPALRYFVVLGEEGGLSKWF